MSTESNYCGPQLSRFLVLNGIFGPARAIDWLSVCGRWTKSVLVSRLV
jgi:hypothetical protein